MIKPKLWKTDIGMIVGLAIGFAVWWSAYDPTSGLLQNLQLLIIPAALGVLVVVLRNRHKKVGPFDPAIIKQNKQDPL